MPWLSLWSLGPNLSRADLDEIKALGFSGIEVWAEHPRASQHLTWARRAHLEISLHLPFHDLNLASPDETVARHASTILRRWLHRLGAAGGRHAVLHGGSAWASEQRPRTIEQLLRRLPAVMQTAAQQQVSVLLENLAPDCLRYTHPVASDLQEWLALLRATDTQACLDLGHLALAGCDLADALDALGPRLGSVHYSERDSRGDAHLLPGDGTVSTTRPWQLLRQIGFRGPVVYEINPYQYSKEALFARLQHEGLGGLW